MKSVTNVFRSLPVVHEVQRLETLSPEAVAFTRETITLGWEDRLKIRARRVTDTGHEFATTLPRGTTLREGDCLVLESRRLVICVMEAIEPVLVIRPVDAMDAALFAYHVGNSHQPMMLSGDLIICPDLLGMAQLLEYHRIPFERAQRSFTPVGQVIDHRHGVAR